MTLTDLNTKYPRLIVPQPFASKTGAAMTPITDGSESTVGNVVNFKDGFPAIYSTPQSGGGKYVGRGDMNALGDLASRNQFRRLCGVINTFDSDFCTKIGGYPEGVVLQWLDGNYLRDVISLVDNNTSDFRNNGVDGTNWKLLNPVNASTDMIAYLNNKSFGEMSAIATESGMLNTTIFSAKTPRLGVLSTTFMFGQRTVSSASGTKSFSISLKYLTPEQQATPQSTGTTVKLASDQEEGGGYVVSPIQLPAGTIFSIYMTLMNIKLSSFSASVYLI